MPTRPSHWRCNATTHWLTWCQAVSMPASASAKIGTRHGGRAFGQSPATCRGGRAALLARSRRPTYAGRPCRSPLPQRASWRRDLPLGVRAERPNLRDGGRRSPADQTTATCCSTRPAPAPASPWASKRWCATTSRRVGFSPCSKVGGPTLAAFSFTTPAGE